MNTPRKMAFTGTKEGRQSRYKTTCLLIILILFSVFRQPKQKDVLMILFYHENIEMYRNYLDQKGGCSAKEIAEYCAIHHIKAFFYGKEKIDHTMKYNRILLRYNALATEEILERFHDFIVSMAEAGYDI